MGKKKPVKYFEDLRKVVYGGAVVTKTTDLLKHAKDPTALGGDVQGFVGVGIGGVMSRIASKPLGMIYGKKKKRKKRR